MKSIAVAMFMFSTTAFGSAINEEFVALWKKGSPVKASFLSEAPLNCKNYGTNGVKQESSTVTFTKDIGNLIEVKGLFKTLGDSFARSTNGIVSEITGHHHAWFEQSITLKMSEDAVLMAIYLHVLDSDNDYNWQHRYWSYCTR